MACSCAQKKKRTQYQIGLSSNPEMATVEFVSPVNADGKVFFIGDTQSLRFSLLAAILSVVPFAFNFKDSKRSSFLEAYPQLSNHV